MIHGSSRGWLATARRTPLTTTPRKRYAFLRTLYFRVLVGIVLGILAGIFYPQFAQYLKPFGDGFIKLIRMLVAPVIFLSVVVGIASVGDTRKLGRVGLKALFYFEAVTTLALLIGMGVAKLLEPGSGMNIDPATLDASAVAKYASQGSHLGAADFLLNIIPETFVGAFTNGEILQVLLLAILCGIALASLDKEKRLVDLAH